MNGTTQINTATTAFHPLVFVRNGTVFANSRDVASYFEKRHDHVLRDIDTLISAAPSIAPNFGEYAEDVRAGFGRRSVRSFDMTRTGFTLLAMRFTGVKALHFQIVYVEAFEEMEAELRSLAPTRPGFPTTLQEALRLAAKERDKRKELEAQKKAMENVIGKWAPKVGAFDTFMSTDGTFSSTEVAKQTGFRSAQALHAHLHAESVLRKGRRGQWLPRAAFAGSGYFKVITQRYGNSVRTHTAWTPSGQHPPSIGHPHSRSPGCEGGHGRGASRFPPMTRETSVRVRKATT